MTAEHHPSLELLSRDALGQLPLVLSVTVSAHWSKCKLCGTIVNGIIAEQAKMIGQVPASPLDPDAFEKILHRIATDVRPVLARKPTIGDVVLPESLAGVGCKNRVWFGAGFWCARVNAPEEQAWRTFLVRAPANARIPKHTHKGLEYIAVLKGGFAGSEPLKAGDFSQRGPGKPHFIQVDAAEPCACLISVQGRTEWAGAAKLIGLLAGV